MEVEVVLKVFAAKKIKYLDHFMHGPTLYDPLPPSRKPSGQPLDTPRMVAGHMLEARARSI